jgi:Fe-S cluster assembly protein SufD
MSVVAFKLDPHTDAFRRDFAANGGGLPGAGLSWLDARRAKAMDAFVKTGIPNRRVEAWKFTDLASAIEDSLEPVSKGSSPVVEKGVFGSAAGARAVMVHGMLHRAVIEDGIEIVDLGALGSQTPDWVREHLGTLACGAEQPMGAASLALMRGGVAILVRKSATFQLDFVKPLLDRNAVSHSRVLILVEDYASLRLLESHAGEGGRQNIANIGMELVLKKGTKLEHVRVQADESEALNIVSIGGTLARDSQYRALCVAAGGRLSRVDALIRLAEPGASAAINSVAVLDAGIADTTTIMDHASPHTTSRQLFKSVVGGRGRSVAQGRVTVREGAVKSDSHQLFKAILMSPYAEADAKPELEILADDVVCGHGTAIGALEADALFYLRARGIPEAEAKGMLTRAFLDDAVAGFGDEGVHAALWARLDPALARAGGGAA